MRSSSWVQEDFFTSGLRWLCQRSRHCLPMRPCRCLAMMDQRLGPYLCTSSMTCAHKRGGDRVTLGAPTDGWGKRAASGALPRGEIRPLHSGAGKGSALFRFSFHISPLFSREDTPHASPPLGCPKGSSNPENDAPSPIRVVSEAPRNSARNNSRLKHVQLPCTSPRRTAFARPNRAGRSSGFEGCACSPWPPNHDRYSASVCPRERCGRGLFRGAYLTTYQRGYFEPQ